MDQGGAMAHLGQYLAPPVSDVVLVCYPVKCGEFSINQFILLPLSLGAFNVLLETEQINELLQSICHCISNISDAHIFINKGIKQ
jgi:uncharacterized membrane protein YccF (DUF307 family)